MQETYNPGRAAKQIGVPPSTLRLWARTYAEFLSEGANPDAGQERRFTLADVQTLKDVAQMRHNGMLPPDITQRLRNNAAGSQQDAPQSSVTELDVSTHANSSHDAIQAFLQRTEVNDRLRDVDGRLERIEAKRLDTWWFILVAVVCLIAGVLLGVAIVWFVLAYMR